MFPRVLHGGMGLPTFARDYLKQKYLGAFSFKSPDNATVVVYDLMQSLKAIPDDIMTVQQVVTYLVNKIKSILMCPGTQVHTVIVLVDREPPPVKRMVEHKKRHARVDKLHEDGGPYLPADGSGLLPSPWISFASNYRLLQRELYPRLFNEFMDALRIIPAKGQSIVLHGFPGRVEYVRQYVHEGHTLNTDRKGRAPQVYRWNEQRDLPITGQMEQDDPDLYNRVFIIEHVAPDAQWPQGFLSKREWVEAHNTIREADGAMFFYDHFYPRDTIMFMCNDGDVFSYGMLYAYERTTLNNTFRNVHYVCLPYKKQKGNEFFAPGQAPRNEYVDLNQLYVLVKNDPSMQSAGVQNHVATLVFLLIMAGSDFFQDAFKGLGNDTVVWQTFLGCTETFSHMVQLSKALEPDTRTPRTIVLDEDLFRLFTHYCYLTKYGKPLRKRAKGKPVTYAALKVQCATGKRAQADPDYQLPDRNTIRLWARQVHWNLMYYKNAPCGQEPDCFQQWMGLPYYPYVRDEAGECHMTTVVSAYQRPVDEVYLRHMHRHKRGKRPPMTEEEQQARKQRIIETIAE
jgi:hypothetical protein